MCLGIPHTYKIKFYFLLLICLMSIQLLVQLEESLKGRGNFFLPGIMLTQLLEVRLFSAAKKHYMRTGLLGYEALDANHVSDLPFLFPSPPSPSSSSPVPSLTELYGSTENLWFPFLQNLTCFINPSIADIFGFTWNLWVIWIQPRSFLDDSLAAVPRPWLRGQTNDL